MMTLHAGLTFAETFYISGVDSASGYALRGRLVSTKKVEGLSTGYFTASATTYGWQLKIPKEVTAAYVAGKYALQIISVLGDEERMVRQVAVTVISAEAGDLRTPNRIILDQLEEVILKKSMEDLTDLEISDGVTTQKLSRMEWPAILNARDRYKRLVDREERPGSGRIRTHKVRF